MLAGCISTSNISHKYTPTPTPELAGYWVGAGGGQTQFLLIRKDGTGEKCWESMSTYRTTPLTISGDKIITIGEANLARNSDGTISECYLGFCITSKRTEHVAGGCREFLKQ